jgi:aromatic O-demethylase, cytochrome P450 subunit
VIYFIFEEHDRTPDPRSIASRAGQIPDVPGATMTTTSVSSNWIDEITLSQLERNLLPIYERLRNAAPLAFVAVPGAYVASTAEVCREVATSPDFQGFIPPAAGKVFGHPAIIGSNGPLHKDLRSMIDPALQSQEVGRYIEDLVRSIACHYIERIEKAGHADLVTEFGEPVRVRAVGDFLCFKTVSSEKLRDWFHKLSNSFTNVEVDAAGEFTNPDGFLPGEEVKTDIRAVIEPLLNQWTIAPDDSAISHWLHEQGPINEF